MLKQVQAAHDRALSQPPVYPHPTTSLSSDRTPDCTVQRLWDPLATLSHWPSRSGGPEAGFPSAPAPWVHPCYLPSVYFLWFCGEGALSRLFWCLQRAPAAPTLPLAAGAPGAHRAGRLCRRRQAGPLARVPVEALPSIPRWLLSLPHLTSPTEITSK